MSPNIKAQIAAIAGILILASITLTPWLAGSYWLTPQEVKWHATIKHKEDLVQQMLSLDREVSAYKNIPEKREVNHTFKKNMERTTVDALQAFVSSNPKYQISNFKISQVPDSKEIKVSLMGSYNALGQFTTDLWNTYQFMELTSLIIKPNQNHPEDEVVASFSVKLP
jgi:Tfp pilus assembly protein PilO